MTTPYSQLNSAAQIRKLILASVSPEDIIELSVMLMERAKAGNVAAAKQMLELLVGKSGGLEQELMLQIEHLESQLQRLEVSSHESYRIEEPHQAIAGEIKPDEPISGPAEISAATGND